MPKDIELISKEFAEKPIKVPGSPFWNVFRRFGRDELIAMFINVIGTAIASLFIAVPILLALVGPVVEKIGFFVAHFKEAIGVYRTTSKEKRKSLSFYLKGAVKNGSTSLTEDILVHDPIYIVLMFVGLSVYPGTPVWLLSIASFVIAVFLVAGLEVLYTELRYLRFKKRMKKLGFGFESYFESRFFISSEKKPSEVMQKLIKAFNLSESKTLEYGDVYFENKLPHYSGRRPKIRLRQRTDDKGNGWIQTAQIVYARAQEAMKNVHEQYRYFLIRKEKMYFMLKGKKMPKDLSEIEDKKIGNVLKSFCDGNVRKIEFERSIAHNEELAVSVDRLKSNRNFYLLELKVYKDVRLMMEAMRFVMREFPVVQTTHGKADMKI